MIHTTATAAITQLPTIADMRRAVEQMEALPEQTEWVLVAPDGRMWKGDIDKLFAVMAQHHSLLKPMGWVQP